MMSSSCGKSSLRGGFSAENRYQRTQEEEGEEHREPDVAALGLVEFEARARQRDRAHKLDELCERDRRPAPGQLLLLSPILFDRNTHVVCVCVCVRFVSSEMVRTHSHEEVVHGIVGHVEAAVSEGLVDLCGG